MRCVYQETGADRAECTTCIAIQDRAASDTEWDLIEVSPNPLIAFLDSFTGLFQSAPGFPGCFGGMVLDHFQFGPDVFPFVFQFVPFFLCFCLGEVHLESQFIPLLFEVFKPTGRSRQKTVNVPRTQ